MSGYVLPLVLGGVLVYALYARKSVFSLFVQGAKQGLTTTLGILPNLVGLLTAVYMLRASGIVELLTHALSPALNVLGIPPEVLPLMLLKPFTGSGALAIGADIIARTGADSFAGRVAAVLMASSETTFYVVTVYFGAVGVRRTRWAIPAALCGDLAAFFTAALAVRLVFG